VTPEIASRLGKYLGTSAEVWLNLQKNYDEAVTNQKEDSGKTRFQAENMNDF
jgi:plasmid maintenance system antidote protein VapI